MRAMGTMIIAVLAALTIEHYIGPTIANAQLPASPLQGLTVYANTYGVSSQKFDAFVFVNQQTGDIWVYRDEEPRHHYRVVAMGEPLQELK